MPVFRKISSTKLSNAQKKTLRDYFNSQNGTTYGEIRQFTRAMGLANSDETYEAIRDLYNDTIIEQQRKQKLENTKARREAKKENKTQKYYQQNVVVFDHSNYENSTSAFMELLRNYRNKSIVIDYIENGEVVFSRREDIPNDFNKWWKEFGVWIIYVDSDKTIFQVYPEGKAYIYEGDKNIQTDKIKQYFKEGNVNCLLKPILKWAEGCREESKSKSSQSRYNAIISRLQVLSQEIGDNGVSEAEMVRISADAQVDISIEKPIICSGEKYVEETKASKKPLKHFIMRNTKFNHVDINEFLYLNNIEIVSRDELYKIKKQLVEDDVYFEFKRDLTGYSSINTLEKTWKLSNDFQDKINEFEVATGLSECYIDDMDDAELSKFIKYGTHYNATVDFCDVYDVDINEVNHADMKNAYALYKKCSVYSGFLGKITDFRRTNKIEGVGMYEIRNIRLTPTLQKWNDKLKVYYDGNIYPSCELEWLSSQGCSFDITVGCWGVKPLDFDMAEHEFLFEKYDGIKGYAKYVGMCDSHYLTKKFSCRGDASLASTIENAVWYSNNEITVSYPKKHNYHIGHFTAFILSYQRIQMLDQLLQMKYDNIVRVCVDGIYYNGAETLNDGFLPKTKKTFDNVAGDGYISNLMDESIRWECGDYKTNHSRELYIGEGGNGKTHKNLLDLGLIRPLYIAPSWKLASKKSVEYDVYSEVWANILTTDPAKYGSIKRRYNVFIIDEVSMMTEENKNAIFAKYDNIKLIFCGDIGYQAPPFSINGEPITEITTKGFGIIHNEKINYRYKCETLKSIIATVREMIRTKKPNKDVNDYVKSVFTHCADIKTMYSIDDMILARTHETKNKYTEMFNHLEKWYITKNTRLYKNGEIVIGPKPDTQCEIQHSYTIHSIQGETADGKLFISMEKTYDSRLLYTAISRARKAEQIYLLL